MVDKKGITSMFVPLLFVLVLLCMEYHFLFVSGEITCLEKERDALLKFKQGFIDDYGFLASWGSEDNKKECCMWWGVVCSNTTGHVTDLGLSGFRGEINSALLELSYLEYLDLSFNDFGGNRIPEFIGSIERLQHFSLFNSSFSGIVPPQLGNLTNLRGLDLGHNSLRSDNLNWLSHLSLLSNLNLDYVNISDANWLRQVLKLRSLQHLLLSYCKLTDVASSATLSINSSFTSLSELDLSYNQLTSSTFDWLINISTSLVSLNLDHNQLEGPIPPNAFENFLLLESLVLNSNKLTGPLPQSIGQLSNLKYLDLSFNFLKGTIVEANFMKLNSLTYLDLSFNSLTFNLSPHWIPPFRLNIIVLASCKMGPSFPQWLHTQIGFVYYLDISGAGISVKVPKWLWDTPPSYLNLSRNEISGTIPNILPNFILGIDVSFNKFSGPVPLLHPNVSSLHLSQNQFSGPISSICTVSASMLIVLDLSNNQLAGQLPNCWENTTGLIILNLSNNNFSGEIPHAFGSLATLVTLHLRGNNFSGEFPSTLKNCTLLQLIDIGQNKLTGNISSWLGGDYPNMTYLSLRQNRFYGGIPPEICYLTQIQLLDLSENNISGKIPGCFNNFTTLTDKSKTTYSTYWITGGFFRVSNLYIDYVLVQWKGKASEYRNTLGLLKFIDLSSNRLVGDIPTAFSSLRALVSLNLSRNNLTGSIDPNIDEMEMLEILDLSRNQISSEIPDGLAQLHYLSILDLSNNNLSGKIPLSTQMQSFNASVYAGNNELCGLPLELCPRDRPTPPVSNQGEDPNDKDDGFFSMPFLQAPWIPIIFGFIVGFWGAVGSLLLNKSWRTAYFNFWDDVGDWLYVARIMFLRKFNRNRI